MRTVWCIVLIVISVSICLTFDIFLNKNSLVIVIRYKIWKAHLFQNFNFPHENTKRNFREGVKDIAMKFLHVYEQETRCSNNRNSWDVDFLTVFHNVHIILANNEIKICRIAFVHSCLTIWILLQTYYLWNIVLENGSYDFSSSNIDLVFY